MILIRKGAMGDTIMLTPIVRELRLQNPDEYIGIKTFYPNVFDNNPYVDAASNSLTKNGEKIISLDGAYEKNFDIHPVDSYAKAVGVELSSKRIELFHTDKDRTIIDNWWKNNVPDNKPVIVLHLGLTWVPVQTVVFDDLIDKMHKEYSFILVGQRNHSEYYPKDPSKVIDLTVSKFSIQQLSWLIEKADCYFGTDTGILHVAGTTSTPICCCFSFVNPECRKPFREHVKFKGISATEYCDMSFCAERNKRMCPNGDFGGVICNKNFVCARGIDIDMIINGIREVMGEY